MTFATVALQRDSLKDASCTTHQALSKMSAVCCKEGEHRSEPPRRTATPAFNTPCVDVTYKIIAGCLTLEAVILAFIQLHIEHTVHVLHAAFGFIKQISINTALKISVRPPRHHRQQQETAFRGEPQHCLWEGGGGVYVGNLLKSASRTPWSRLESAAFYAPYPTTPTAASVVCARMREKERALASFDSALQA